MLDSNSLEDNVLIFQNQKGMEDDDMQLLTFPVGNTVLLIMVEVLMGLLPIKD